VAAPSNPVGEAVHKCGLSPRYFLDTYASVYDATAAGWLPFRLWRAQEKTLAVLHDHRLTVVLKARQLGLTWLVLGYALWHLRFHPAATVLLFSRRDDEAADLLAVRLRGMYDRLPSALKLGPHPVDNDHEWELANGSRALAFPTTAGDSYTATLAVVDEADLVPDLGRLMAAVKPTIDAGGRMVLLSRPDKSRPDSPFKRVYRAARQGLNGWAPVFLPWSSRPGRDAAWYEAQKADILHRTGSVDDLHEQYPSNEEEALAPRSLDKRLAPEWLRQCFRERRPLDPLPPGAPSLPGLEVYVTPTPGRRFVIGADPAEGNPNSDDSALAVLDRDSGEECAALAGKLQPAVLAAHAAALARYYNGAGLMVERNNHGHAVLLWLRDNARACVLNGLDGHPGWVSSTRGKALLYDACADAFRGGRTVLHSYATFVQLQSIEGASLRAPEGFPDDRADSYALGTAAIVHAPASGRPAAYGGPAAAPGGVAAGFPGASGGR
jgi:hypothetical protein